jgi:chromosome segregation ATPase
VSRILGLWTYSELENDLRQLINSKIPRVFNSLGGPNPEATLAELNGRVITVEGVIKAKRKEHDSLQRDLHEVEVELLEVEDDLKTLGAVDPEELQRAQSRHTELTVTKSKLEARLTEAWELALPISLLGDYRRELHDTLHAEERRREWESAKSTVEPKIPQVKADVFDNPPEDYALDANTETFYVTRLEDALHRLFHPPPEGMPDQIYIADRNETSVQIRSHLATTPIELTDLVEMCASIERMDAELRELNQKVKQMQQNSAAFKRGTELHEKRGKLLGDRDRISKRLKDIEAEIASAEVELGDLKRRESL